jgi:hypothetical protein
MGARLDEPRRHKSRSEAMSRYEKEWPCCGDTSITDAYEPEQCPFCTPSPDEARMDWLMQHTVNVRVHLRYGSRNLFWAGPEEGDGETLPSDLRERIDAEIANTKGAKS